MSLPSSPKRQLWNEENMPHRCHPSAVDRFFAHSSTRAVSLPRGSTARLQVLFDASGIEHVLGAMLLRLFGCGLGFVGAFISDDDRGAGSSFV